MSKPVICLMGPTAAGKTDLALKLAEHFSMELISVDSVMIYREMNIGSAKPSPEVLKRFPHDLIDILNPDEAYSAGRFVQEVHDLIDAIHQRNHIPLLVGGTMLYFHALQTGLAPLPEANEAIRLAIEEKAKQVGWEVMHQQLQQIDHLSAAKIRPQDPQRISRALEVYHMTGQPLSQLQKQASASLGYQWQNLVLYPQMRAWLHHRIHSRFTEMLEMGLIDEVQQVLLRYPKSKDMPAMRAVGYRQVLAYLEGQLDKDTLLEKGVVATRQLAKRQCTWLKSWSSSEWFDPQALDLYEQVKQRIVQ